MSFYEPQGWQAPMRQPSWEQPPPPSRSGIDAESATHASIAEIRSGASSTSQRDENNAFTTQFDEVDRAIDNLVKSGKFYPAGPRRDPTSLMYGMHAPRMHPGRHSVSSHESSPRPRANVHKQNFYAAQRYQGRPSEADQMLQAKRRMAAQRERELRNYHQEQQYNRSVMAEMASNKSDRSLSPSTLSEEGRRDLIARQRQALYGPESSGYQQQGSFGQDNTSQDQTANGPGSGSGGIRGASPRGVDPFGMSTQNENNQQNMAEAKTTSPTGQHGGKIPTPPGADETSHSRSISKSTTAPVGGNMAPIGSKPNSQQTTGQSLNKRTTSPLPTGMSFAFGNTDQSNERTNSSNSNMNTPKEQNPPSMGTWGTGSGVWGSNKIGASVWS